MDRRATAEAEAVEEDRLRHLTGITRDATHMAAKIAWLKRHRTADRKAALFHQPVSYMVARLTGEAVFDHALASTSMLYSLERKDWQPELLEAFGIEASELPRIAAASDKAGVLSAQGAALSGLPEGLPVAVGTGDDFATPLGAGLVAQGAALSGLPEGLPVAVGTGDDFATPLGAPSTRRRRSTPAACSRPMAMPAAGIISKTPAGCPAAALSGCEVCSRSRTSHRSMAWPPRWRPAPRECSSSRR
jgi:xylulokinase